jgi:hypothetical protein
MLFLFAYLCRRFYRGLIVQLVAFSLIWSPVMQARAIVPAAVVLVPAAVMMSRAFVIAATRVGSQLTHTDALAGVGLGLVAVAGANWTAVQGYAINAAANFHSNVTAGVATIASLASSVNVNSIVTDLATFSLSASGGYVYGTYGSTPTKAALPSDPGDTSFPSSPRWDGQPGFLPIAANSFSTVWNASGFRSYLCPLLSGGTGSTASTDACRTLPEMPFSTFNYGTQYQSIGIGCNDPRECAKAYLAARLVTLSMSKTGQQNEQLMHIYSSVISNVSVDLANCFDSRFTGSSSFSSYRCPATLNYQQQTHNGTTYSSPQPASETFNIDVTLNRPSFSQAATLNDYIERYPLAGSQPVTPASLAQIANAMFLAAANRAGYAGINYFPITAADFTAAAQPGEVVPLGSFTTPVTAAPGTGTGTGNPTAPGGSATVDLGPNPSIAQPTLEGIPTAAQIMSPIFDLFPSVRNFQVPGHTSQCPSFVVPFFGQDYGTTKHCELLESQRGPLGAAALVGWSITALIIVLGA